MFQAQQLMWGTTVFSPWIQRGGDNLTAAVDVVANSGSNLTIKLFTKKGSPDVFAANRRRVIASVQPFERLLRARVAV